MVHTSSIGAFSNAEPTMFWGLQTVYWVPLVALLFTKSRAVDTALLGALVLGYTAEPVLEIVARLGSPECPQWVESRHCAAAMDGQGSHQA